MSCIIVWDAVSSAIVLRHLGHTVVDSGYLARSLRPYGVRLAIASGYALPQ